MNDVLSVVPEPQLKKALDDDGDGEADVGAFDRLVAMADRKISSILGRRYTDAQISASDLAQDAESIVIGWMVWNRRGLAGERNPLNDEYLRIMDEMRSVASGKGGSDLAHDIDEASEDGAAEISRSQAYDGDLTKEEVAWMPQRNRLMM